MSARRVIGAALAGVGLSLATSVLAAERAAIAANAAPTAEQVVVVTGSGWVEVQPDRVTIEFTIQCRGKTAAEASDVNVKRTQPVLAALRRLDRIETVSFSASSTDSARQAALTQAVRQARDDAAMMAKAAGGELGPLLEVTTQGTAVPPRAFEVRAMNSMSSPSTVPSITPGPIVVSTTVLGRWGYLGRGSGGSGARR